MGQVDDGVAGASGEGSLTYTFDDGSKMTIENVHSTADWACGKRKTGTYSGNHVVLYLDREGNLFTINVPARDNARIYDGSGARECLKNWKTGKHELMTDAEYRRIDRKFGPPR